MSKITSKESDRSFQKIIVCSFQYQCPINTLINIILGLTLPPRYILCIRSFWKLLSWGFWRRCWSFLACRGSLSGLWVSSRSCPSSKAKWGFRLIFESSRSKQHYPPIQFLISLCPRSSNLWYDNLLLYIGNFSDKVDAGSVPSWGPNSW